MKNIEPELDASVQAAPPVHAKRGRPRSFDAEQALDAAMRIFWKHGYEGASLEELTAAMQINRPSLYAAFGNKEALFRQAVDRYVSQREAAFQDALNEPTARKTVERLLRGGVGGCGKDDVRGCMLVQGALACGEASESVRQELSARRCSLEGALRDRFARGIIEGDLPATTDPAALAKYVATIQQGLAVQSSSGATREQMLATVELALCAFPVDPP